MSSRICQSGGSDALILLGSLADLSAAAQEILTRILKRGLPIVALSHLRLQDYNVDCVIADYRSAAAAAMAHLLTLGHRRIGLVYGVAQAELALDRLQPYQDSLRTAGIPVTDDLIVRCGPTIEDGYQAALRLLEHRERPTAIIAINDLLAIGVLRAAADLGLRVPADFSLVGFDDILEAKYLVPRLTTASKDAVRLGREAAKLALGRIQNPGRPHQVVDVPTRFIIRDSTAIAPVLSPGSP